MRKLSQNMLKLSVFLMLLLAVMTFPKETLKASDLDAAYKRIKTTQLDDITDVMSIQEIGTSISSNVKEITKEGTYVYYYEFCIDKPSYVNIKAYAKIMDLYMEDAYIYLSTSKLFTEERVTDLDLNEGTCDYNTALEAGTYYMKIKIMPEYSDYIASKKVFNLGIYTEPVTRTGTKIGTTMKKAIETGNKTSYGLISTTSKNQFFKFTLNTKSDVALKTIFNAPLQWEDATGRVQLYNGDGSKIGDEIRIDGDDENSATICKKGLSKGTYYVCAYNLEKDEFFTVRQNISIKDVYAPSQPKVSKLKKGAKVVKGTGEAGAKVYVVYNKKTYSATVSSKGTFSVKVPALKYKVAVSVYLKDAAGNKSSTTRVVVA